MCHLSESVSPLTDISVTTSVQRTDGDIAAVGSPRERASIFPRPVSICMAVRMMVMVATVVHSKFFVPFVSMQQQQRRRTLPTHYSAENAKVIVLHNDGMQLPTP